jgi:uncharacterized radical SAM superfamily protein
MRAAVTPSALLAEALELQAGGGTGMLLSGGCDARGRVPLGPFLGTIKEIKRTTSLAVNLHPGLADDQEAVALRSTGADAFSIDVVQDPRVIAEVLHLDALPDHYRRTLELLETSGRLAPHILVGLQSERGETESLDLVASLEVSALIVLGLMDTSGTSGREVSSERLVRFISRAVRDVDAPVLLGCMRPRGRWEDEKAAIEAGVAGIVNPSRGAAEWADQKGLEVHTIEACCAIHL